MEAVVIALIGCLAIVGVLALFISGCFFTVRQQTMGLVERFGRFHRIAKAGLHVKIPVFETVRRINLQVQELTPKVETKTKDNVFVQVLVSVQYQVTEAKVFEAYYQLTNPAKQITSYVFDVVRAKVPTMALDSVFEQKEDIAEAVKHELEAAMDDFGYSIVKALVIDVEPDASVKSSMNEINAAQRLRVAATEKAEAAKVMTITNAEAEAASKRLQGEGIAGQRKAIVDGLKASIMDFQEGVPGSNAHDVMTLVLLTQYFDTLKDIGASGKSHTVFLPHSPGAIGDLSAQIRNAVMMADPPSGVQ